MTKIKPNSLEAIILFIQYICAQDGRISKEEITELAAQLPVLRKLYLDVFGELFHSDLEELIQDVHDEMESKTDLIGKTVTDGEIELFSDLLVDPKAQDVALLAARNEASADGLHRRESDKFQYWANRWGVN